MQGESQEHTLLRSPVSGRKPAFPEPTHKHTSAAISVRTLTDIVPHSVRAHGITQPRQPGASPHEPWTTADDVEGITWCVCVCVQSAFLLVDFNSCHDSASSPFTVLVSWLTCSSLHRRHVDAENGGKGGRRGSAGKEEVTEL